MGYTGKNAEGKFNRKDTYKQPDKKVTINTIQRTVNVDRIAVDKRGYYRNIIYYDIDNMYPNKIKNAAERSQCVKSASGTLASFLTGVGFGEDLNKIIVNEEEDTLFDILFYTAKEKSIFAGFALHFNFNVFGEITEINEISFECLRWNTDATKLIYDSDWQRPKKVNQIEYYPFNLDKVQEQINEVGLDDYTGQVLYWIPRRKDYYTTCRFDDVLEYAQYEYESAVYQLSNIQNDFAFGYLMKLPLQADSQDENKEVIERLREGKGAKNAGNSILLKMAGDSEVLRSKLIEPISRNNIDNLFTNQNDLAERKIYACYNQPPILNGVSSDGMFNQDQYNDAFDYYNSYTETERDQLEKIWTKILNASIFVSEGTEIKIEQKSFIIKKDGGNSTNNGDGGQAIPGDQP